MRTDFPKPGVRAFSLWIFNCYVVDDGGQGVPFIIDAGLPSTGAEAAEHLLRNPPSEPAPLVATHGHSDHLGGVACLSSSVPVRLHLPERDKDYLTGETPRSPSMRAAARILPVMRDARFSLRAVREMGKATKTVGFGGKGPFRLPVEPAGFLSEGDRVPGAPDWTVLNTPGHTDDSISFYNEESRALFCGDALVTLKGRAWFTPEYVDAEKMAGTEARLRQLRVDHLFPGHGHPISGTDLLSGALSHLDRRL